MTAPDPSRRADATGAAFIALAAICFGTLGPLSRFAADAGVSSLTLVTWRAALGAIVVAIFMRGLLRHLNSRIYFADEPANTEDLLLNLVEPGRRPSLEKVS